MEQSVRLTWYQIIFLTLIAAGICFVSGAALIGGFPAALLMAGTCFLVLAWCFLMANM